MEVRDGRRVIDAVSMYVFNATAPEFARDVYGVDFKSAPDHKRAYVVGKFREAAKNFVSFWGNLDYGRRDALVRAAIARFGKEV